MADFFNMSLSQIKDSVGVNRRQARALRNQDRAQRYAEARNELFESRPGYTSSAGGNDFMSKMLSGTGMTGMAGMMGAGGGISGMMNMMMQMMMMGKMFEMMGMDNPFQDMFGKKEKTDNDGGGKSNTVKPTTIDKDTDLDKLKAGTKVKFTPGDEELTGTIKTIDGKKVLVTDDAKYTVTKKDGKLVYEEFKEKVKTKKPPKTAGGTDPKPVTLSDSQQLEGLKDGKLSANGVESEKIEEQISNNAPVYSYEGRPGRGGHAKLTSADGQDIPGRKKGEYFVADSGEKYKLENGKITERIDVVNDNPEQLPSLEVKNNGRGNRYSVTMPDGETKQVKNLVGGNVTINGIKYKVEDNAIVGYESTTKYGTDGKPDSVTKLNEQGELASVDLDPTDDPKVPTKGTYVPYSHITEGDWDYGPNPNPWLLTPPVEP